MRKGDLYGELGRAEEAIKCYDKVIRLNPDHHYAYAGKANELAILRKHKEAIKCYDVAISLKPDWDESHYNKGVALEGAREYEEAIKCYDVAISLNPSTWMHTTTREAYL